MNLNRPHSELPPCQADVLITSLSTFLQEVKTNQLSIHKQWAGMLLDSQAVLLMSKNLFFCDAVVCVEKLQNQCKKNQKLGSATVHGMQILSFLIIVFTYIYMQLNRYFCSLGPHLEKTIKMFTYLR